MPDEKKEKKPKLQYIDKDFQWVLKEPWTDEERRPSSRNTVEARKDAFLGCPFRWRS